MAGKLKLINVFVLFPFVPVFFCLFVIFISFANLVITNWVMSSCFICWKHVYVLSILYTI